MSIFLILVIAGLFGMALMAFPAFNKQGHGMGGHAQIGHLSHAGGAHAAIPSSGHIVTGHAVTAVPHGTLTSQSGGHGISGGKATTGPHTNTLTRFLPSPRMIFSMMASYGAFGYLMVDTFHLPAIHSYWIALILAILLERFLLTPFWNMLMGFQSKPCTPVEQLILTEAEAVTPFRNGKGIVRAVRDGRDIQFSAQLPPTQAHLTVRVGDRLRIEEVATDGEHVKVTLE